MPHEESCLSDGQNACQATLHIKDGQAVVVLHSMFGLRPGTTIPLRRPEGNLLIESAPGAEVGKLGLLNGHGII
jgi:hypothetical protein